MVEFQRKQEIRARAIYDVSECRPISGQATHQIGDTHRGIELLGERIVVSHGEVPLKFLERSYFQLGPATLRIESPNERVSRWVGTVWKRIHKYDTLTQPAPQPAQCASA